MKKFLFGSNGWAILAIFGALIIIGIFLWRENNIIGLTRRDFESRSLPKGFDGYRILHISDLHNKSFGAGQQKLLQICAEASPDLIVITGDLIDKRRTRFENIEPALDLANGAARIAPTFFVCGNHEITSGYYDRLREELMRCGVAVLDDETVKLRSGDDEITLAGIQNANLYSDLKKEEDQAEKDFHTRLASLAQKVETPFSILLSHRPDLFQSVIFCGQFIHAILFCSLLLRLLSFDFSLRIFLAQAGQYLDAPEPGCYLHILFYFECPQNPSYISGT